MKHYFYLFLFVFLSSLSTQAQDKCGVAHQDSILSVQLPAWQQRKARFEAQLQQLQQTATQLRMASYETIRIPVVVHIIHNTASGQIGGSNNPNISDTQIASQIAVLNEDYRRQSGTNGWNTNPVGADMQLEFYLADSLATGETTKGITRHYTSKSNFDFINETAQLAQIVTWNPLKYLNIYVTRSNGTAIGSSGFPFDSFLDGLGSDQSDLALQKIFDGVVIDFRYFGKCCGTLSSVYNLGRTTTHEIGHWLGLLHTNGDQVCGNDYCADTPTIEKLNLSTNCNTITSTCNSVKVTNQIENYMDYSPDACMNLFTNDQKTRTRMALTLSARRKALVNANLVLPESNTLTLGIEPNPSVNNPNLKISYTGTHNAQLQVFSIQGTQVYNNAFTLSGSTYLTLNTSNWHNGIYFVRITTDDNASAIQRLYLVR